METSLTSSFIKINFLNQIREDFFLSLLPVKELLLDAFQSLLEAFQNYIKYVQSEQIQDLWGTHL